MNIKILYYIGIFCLSSILALNHIFYVNNAQNSDRGINLPNVFAISQLTNQSTEGSASDNNSDSMPLARVVYESQSIKLPNSVGIVVWFIVNEAHEDTQKESQKLVSDHNPDYIPTKLIMPQGVSVLFLDADAPWDTPHPHTIEIKDKDTGKVVFSTGKLDYTNSSKAMVLSTGNFTVEDTKYPWMKGEIIVMPNDEFNMKKTLTLGGFITPTNHVGNNKDNDGGVHPGWLGYYREVLPQNGFKILSEFNFHYATCSYCPGKFWPDQKTADHTLIMYGSTQPIEQTVEKLIKLVWDNVYI
jgi:hypothetical protein